MKRNTLRFLRAVAVVSFVVGPSGLVAQTADKVAAGEQLYTDYCSTCHGFELKNTGGVTFDLRRLRPDDHDRFVNSVLNGKSQMPPWRGVLNGEQIESIWAFIRATVDR
jgi:mono/diheme cytochrome c family protein